MSNNKQSSVEWLWDKFVNKPLKISDLVKLLEQAKAMHKEEMVCSQMDMFNHLNNLPYGLQYLEKRQSAEDFSFQYYNKTYGGNNDNP